MVEAGLVGQLQSLGWRVKFDGHHQFEEIKAADDPPIGVLKNPKLVSRVTQSVAKVIGDHIAKGELPVTLGGDHSLVHLSDHLLLAVDPLCHSGARNNFRNPKVGIQGWHTSQANPREWQCTPRCMCRLDRCSCRHQHGRNDWFG
jgi:hypothetical protein